ncbi:hypothetical protein TNCV_3271561 [Trichonephila clavipes]|nr:hypothetical protein TNCV_3271561 [Trichonephila clavipes]
MPKLWNVEVGGVAIYRVNSVLAPPLPFSHVVPPSVPSNVFVMRQVFKRMHWAVGNPVVSASDSRPEALGSMPDASKVPPSKHRVRAH